MSIWDLTRRLVHDTWIQVKDITTGKTVWEGKAENACFNDTVRDWDFSSGHVIYIGRGEK